MNVEETISQAKELRSEDKLEESLALLENLLIEHSANPQVLFELGGAHDVLGVELDAIPYYEQAIEEGLSGDDLAECLICLGSCHRAIGQFQEAVDVLEAYVERFPDQNAGLPFLAIAYYSNGQYEDAVRLLLDLILDTTSDEEILAFSDPIDYYKDNLDEVFEN